MLVKAFPAGVDSLVNAGGALFFIAIDFLGTTKDLWTSDGTAAGTQMVANLCSGFCPFQQELPLTPVGRRVFFGNESPGAGRELWTSDGTPIGTGMVKDILPGPGTSYPSDLVGFRGKLFFSAAEDLAGPALWSSDGTIAGTQMVKDIDPRPDGSPDWKG
jgi:ELWxxDGT repeat protein